MHGAKGQNLIQRDDAASAALAHANQADLAAHFRREHGMTPLQAIAAVKKVQRELARRGALKRVGRKKRKAEESKAHLVDGATAPAGGE
jgi:hypothetical protein